MNKGDEINHVTKGQAINRLYSSLCDIHIPLFLFSFRITLGSILSFQTKYFVSVNDSVDFQ